MKQKIRNIPEILIILQIFIFQGGNFSFGQAPVANFSATPISGCSPLIVSFQDLSTGNPTSWYWNFGNGNSSTLQNPTTSYITPGTYTVTLTVTNSSGTNTLTRDQYITVYENPTVSFTSNITSGCFPLHVQFQDLSTSGAGNTNVSWLWDFGNGNTSTQQNPLVTYSFAGTFSVTLLVTNDKGCTRAFSRTNYINVINGVTAGFTHTQATVCRPPANISFTNTSTGPPTLSYLWDFGDGSTSTLQNPVHTYTTSGSYTVTLVTFNSAGCQDTARSNPIVIGGFNTTFNAPNEVCVNKPVTFTNTSTPTPVSSIWHFGDGATASTLNASHSYSTPGIYTVRLYNSYTSCNDSAFQTIRVNPEPVANFTAPVTTRCEPPLTVNFQDLSGGGAVSWFWDFGDGNTSTLQNPSHTYTSYGSFTIKLVVTNSFGCVDSIIRPDYVIIRRAHISIPGLPTRGCIPFIFTFNPVISSVDAVTSYSWNFGDGFTSTLPNPTHTYTNQGTYTVRLTITTSSGCTDEIIVENAIRVGSKPLVNFVATPLEVCYRNSVQFTNLSVPSDEWLWDFGDGSTSTQENPTHQFNDVGYFTIRLIAWNNGCPDTIIKSNYIHVLPPIAQFSITPDCNNRLRFSFTDQSVLPLSWQWDFGDGSTSTQQNPVHVFSSYGTYIVKLIVTNGNCIDSVSKTVHTIDENPNITASPVTACRNSNIEFTATNINTANISSYFWNFGDGHTVTVSTPSVIYAYVASGNYTVTLTTTDINGCTNTRTIINLIRINGPVANFSATNTAGCTGLTTTFNDLSITDGIHPITNWQFNFGDGTVQSFTGPPFQHTYNNTGSFSVKLVVTDAAGCKDSITRHNLIVTTDPVPDFISNNLLSCPGANVSFQNNSSPLSLLSFLWEFGDGNTSTATNPTHSYAATGIYTVKLTVTDNNGCTDSLIRTNYITVDVPVADFKVNDTVSSCTPFKVEFTNNSKYFASVLWNFGAGYPTSTLSNPTCYFNSPGIYPVKLEITSPGGCRDSMTKIIRVYDTAGTTINFIPAGGCKPLTVNFNAFIPAPIDSFLWDFGDGNIKTVMNPSTSHVYNSFGNLIPKLIMRGPSGCVYSLTSPDTLFIVGTKAKFGLSDSLFCDFGSVHFSDSSTFNDPIISYNWSFGDGATSTQQNPTHQYNSPGLYTVQLAVQTQNGCTDTLRKPNLVAVVQRPLIDIGGDSIICIHSSLTHTGLFIQPDTSKVTWLWNFPNGNTSVMQNPPPQTYNTAGSFAVTAIATNSSGCKDTVVRNIKVNPLPTINIPAQITIQNGFTATIPASYSSQTISWNWTPATGLSCTNCPTPVASPKFTTLYNVRFTDVNGCSNRGNIQVIVICKNYNLFIPNLFSPNGDGNNDIFYPRGIGLERIKLLRIFNRWGEVVFERRDVPVNDPSAGWNGSYKGNKPIADVYVYQAEVFCENGELIKLNGNITLIL